MIVKPTKAVAAAAVATTTTIATLLLLLLLLLPLLLLLRLFRRRFSVALRDSPTIMFSKRSEHKIASAG